MNWRQTVFITDKEGNDFALAAPTEQMFHWITYCPYSKHFFGRRWKTGCQYLIAERLKRSELYIGARSYFWEHSNLQRKALTWLWILAWLGCAPKHLMSLKSPGLSFLTSWLICGVSGCTSCLFTNNWAEPLVFTKSAVWITLSCKVKGK